MSKQLLNYEDMISLMGTPQKVQYNTYIYEIGQRNSLFITRDIFVHCSIDKNGLVVSFFES